MKTKALLGILGILSLVEPIGGNIGPRKNLCENYQGFREDQADVSISYVFDASGPSRQGAPKLSVEGDPDYRKSLTIGERYCLEYTDPIIPWERNKLRKIKSEAENQ